MNFRVIGASAIVLAALLFPVSGANAQTFAFDYSNKNIVPAGDPTMIGYSFTVNKAVTVTDLDIFDTGFFFSSAAIRTGIWDSKGNLLTSGYVYVDGTGTSFTAPSGHVFFAVPIFEITLTPGDYVIGGLYGKDDAYVHDGSAVADPAFQYQEGLFRIPSFAMPNFPQAGNPFGPTFRYKSLGATPQPDVPEPGVIAFGIIAAGGVLGMIARNRAA